MKYYILFLSLIFNIASCQTTNKPEQNESDYVDFGQNYLSKLNETGTGNTGLLTSNLFIPNRGQFETYLIYKKGGKHWYDSINQKYGDIGNYVNKLPKDSIDNNFNAWVFYTDQKYLLKAEDGSPTLKIPSIITLYNKIDIKKWIKIKEFNIKNQDDEFAFLDWKVDFINTLSDESGNQTSKNELKKLSKNWYGNYTAWFSYGEIGGSNQGWSLEINISKDSIIASGDGYQIGFKDELSFLEPNSDTLILNHKAHLKGNDLGKEMNPEFILIKNNQEYYVRTKWVDGDIITKAEKFGYKMEKNQD